MNEIDSARDWLLGATPSQFLLGVIVLIFGTQKILSAENVERSLGGLALPAKWLQRRREAEAEEKIAEVAQLRDALIEVQEELNRVHKWVLYATKRIRTLDSVLVANGVEIPPPDFLFLHEFGDRESGDDEEEEDH